MHYDNSPLNRSTGVTPPGQDWAAHPTAIAYKTNSAAVQHWRVNSDGSFSSFSFEANTLYVNENADEDGHITRTYTDKLGQVVLKEAVDENGVALKTFVYLRRFWVVALRGATKEPPKRTDCRTQLLL